MSRNPGAGWEGDNEGPEGHRASQANNVAEGKTTGRQREGRGSTGRKERDFWHSQAPNFHVGSGKGAGIHSSRCQSAKQLCTTALPLHHPIHSPSSCPQALGKAPGICFDPRLAAPQLLPAGPGSLLGQPAASPRSVTPSPPH